MPNHVTNIVEASPEVIATFLVPITDAERETALAEAQRMLDMQTARKTDLDAQGPVLFAEHHGRYMAENVERWVTEAREHLDALTSNPPTHRLSFAGVVAQPEGIETEGCAHILTDVKAGEPEEDGVICWYKWNSANWGTKWDMYTTRLARIEGSTKIRLSFETAWATPEPVIVKLQEMHRGEDIHALFADEDTGSNYGYYTDEAGFSFAAIGLDRGVFASDVNTVLALLIQNHDGDVVEALLQRRRDEIEYDGETSMPEEVRIPELVEAAQGMLAETTGVDLRATTSPMEIGELVAVTASSIEATSTKLIESRTD